MLEFTVAPNSDDCITGPNGSTINNVEAVAQMLASSDDEFLGAASPMLVGVLADCLVNGSQVHEAERLFADKVSAFEWGVAVGQFLSADGGAA